MIEYTDIVTNETGIIELWKGDKCEKYTSDEFLDFLNQRVNESIFGANMIDVLTTIIIDALSNKLEKDNETFDALTALLLELSKIADTLETMGDD